jgi:hypothetical protein
MLEQPICKLCGHSFGDHNFVEYEMAWFCTPKGESCACDVFVIAEDNMREKMYDKFYLN